jgi:hypothetical protein
MRVEKTTSTIETIIERYHCTEQGCTFSTLSKYDAERHEGNSHSFDQRITFGDDEDDFLHFPSAEHYAKYIRHINRPCRYPYIKDGWFWVRYSDDYGYSTTDVLSVIDNKLNAVRRILKEAHELKARFLPELGTTLASSPNHGLPEDSEPLQEP